MLHRKALLLLTERELRVRFLGVILDECLRGPSAQKKLFYLCSDFDGIFFLSEVKFNYKTLLLMSKFLIFLIYKKLQLFFQFLKILIFLLVSHFSMNFSQIL